MPFPQAASEHYREQQRLTVAVVANMRRLWSQMGDDFDSSWQQVGPRVVALLAAAQVATARSSDDYVSAVLAETEEIDDPVGRVNPRRFAGTTSGGKPLADLAVGAVIRAKTAKVKSSTEALAVGGRWLDMATQTAIADTSRSATSVAIASRPDVTGYVRMVSLPACTRCSVLAGKAYRWNSGFLRHPRCDCRHIPASPRAAREIIPNELRITNAVPLGGMQLATTSRGGVTTADSIIARATDRTEAIELLRRFGFVA